MARTRGERAGLTREAIVAAARGLLEERGIAGLAMRPVAKRLGVAPNALYTYVENKGALLDAVLDDLIAAIAVPPTGIAPRTRIERIMLDSFDALLEHPDLAAVTIARQGSGSKNAWRLGDAIRAAFAELGVPDTAARDTLRILLVHMMGSAAYATGYDTRLGGQPHLDPVAARTDYATALGWLLDGVLE